MTRRDQTSHHDGAPETVTPPAVEPAALYVGEVMHRRLRPFGHRFTYRVFSMLIDIDRIDEVATVSRLFSHNRFNVFSFHDRDHGPVGAPTGGDQEQTPPSLRGWVLSHLDQAGIDIGTGRVILLCFPRVLGYVFNPLSIYFCHDDNGYLKAILYEVHNTFGDRHGYLMNIRHNSKDDRRVTATVHRHQVVKDFHVSPFIDMDARYDFSIRVPEERLAVRIRESDADGDLLLATLTGKRRAFTDSTLVRLFITHPLMTVKVFGAIHWQALKLWWKGARFHPRPAPPRNDVTLASNPASAPRRTTITPTPRIPHP